MPKALQDNVWIPKPEAETLNLESLNLWASNSKSKPLHNAQNFFTTWYFAGSWATLTGRSRHLLLAVGKVVIWVLEFYTLTHLFGPISQRVHNYEINVHTVSPFLYVRMKELRASGGGRGLSVQCDVTCRITRAWETVVFHSVLQRTCCKHVYNFAHIHMHICSVHAYIHTYVHPLIHTAIHPCFNECIHTHIHIPTHACRHVWVARDMDR